MTETTPPIDPRHAILLVMDYQVGIVQQLPDAAALLARTRAAIELARSHGVAIGYVRVAFTEADYRAVPATNKAFAALAAGHRMDDAAPETAIHATVAPEPGDIIVRKTRVGAFSTTDLPAQLRARQIDTLLLAGISTSGVVLSTVRWASDLDYQLLVVGDACADFDDEVHRVLMEKVFPGQATVLTTEAFLQALEAKAK